MMEHDTGTHCRTLHFVRAINVTDLTVSPVAADAATAASWAAHSNSASVVTHAQLQT